MRRSRKFASYQRQVTRTLNIDGYEVNPYMARVYQGPGWYYREDKYGTATLDRMFYYIKSYMTKYGPEYKDTLQLYYNKYNGYWVMRNVQSGATIDETPFKNPVKPPLMWALQMLDVMG